MIYFVSPVLLEQATFFQRENVAMAVQGIDPSTISVSKQGMVRHQDLYASGLAENIGTLVKAGGVNDLCTNQGSCRGTNIDCTNSGACGGSKNIGSCNLTTEHPIFE